MADLYILYKTYAMRRKGKTAGREQQTDCTVATQQNATNHIRTKTLFHRSVIIMSFRMITTKR